jgi:2-polyprenyl-3-methyl-5-hydroxy-6-metoxy-1,4-benzoquinol methylase
MTTLALGQPDRLRPCPACGTRTNTALQILTMERVIEQTPYYSEEFFATLGIGIDDQFELVQCPSCGLAYIGNPPSDDVLDRLYSVDDTSLHEHVSVFARPERMANQLQVYARLLHAVARRVDVDAKGVPLTPVEILDFGAAIGAGILAVARQGFPYRTYAVESSPSVLGFLTANGVNAHPDLKNFPEGQRFDAIILNDVLEHVRDPVGLLRVLGARLKSKGVIWIAVPDFSEWRLGWEIGRYRRGESFTIELNPLEHLTYFSPATLDRVSGEAGLRRLVQTSATIPVPIEAGVLRGMKNILRATRDAIRAHRHVTHHYTTAALFERAGHAAHA